MYDEYVPIENIKSPTIQRGDYKKDDKVFVQWGETGESYEARLLKYHRGTLINISFPDLGQDWEYMVARTHSKVTNEKRETTDGG